MDGASLLLPPSPTRGWEDGVAAAVVHHNVESEAQLVTHPGRWWVLWWCSVICAAQGLIWNTCVSVSHLCAQRSAMRLDMCIDMSVLPLTATVSACWCFSLAGCLMNDWLQLGP